MRSIILAFLLLLCTACSILPQAVPTVATATASATGAVVLSASPTNPPAPSATSSPAPTATPAPTYTPAPTATPPAPPRWYWAVRGQQVLAFNTTGQINEVLDLSGVQLGLNDYAPIRISDESAVLFLFNNDHPKVFVVTSDAARELKVPDVRAAFLNNGWSLEEQSGPYLVFAAQGHATMPAMLINAESSQVDLLATNVTSATSVHILPDGKTMRYAVGSEEIQLHSRDLETGEDRVVFEAGKSLAAGAGGELWFEGYKNRGITSSGEPFSFMDQEDNTRHFLLNENMVLASSIDCEAPCSLRVYPALEPEKALTYQLPFPLVDREVLVTGGYIPGQDQLLVEVIDYATEARYPAVWLLWPDGKSQQLGYELDFSFMRYLGRSAEGRSYILVSAADDAATYSLIDLTTAEAVFTHTSAGPDPLIEVDYFAWGVLVSDWADVGLGQYWVVDFESGAAVRAQTSGKDEERCTTLTTEGGLLCFSEGGDVLRYDLASGSSSVLVSAPVSLLSR